MKRVLSALFAALVLGAAGAYGQVEGNPENWCRNGLFPKDSESYSIAQIRGRSRVYFRDDVEGCPDGKKCRKKSYVIPGDEVIVSRTYGNFACAWFQPKSGYETVGWIPVSVLNFKTGRAGGPSDFEGSWRFYDNTVTIRQKKAPGTWQVTGEAFWKGLGDNIHIGELEGEGRSTGSRLEYGDPAGGQYECLARFIRVGRYLIGSDNGNCGGANVTFNGVYVRK